MKLEEKIIQLVQAIGIDVGGVGSNLGDLEQLPTENKESLVNALIELFDKIGDLDDLDTSDKSSIVSAINQIFNAGADNVKTFTPWTPDVVEGGTPLSFSVFPMLNFGGGESQSGNVFTQTPVEFNEDGEYVTIWQAPIVGDIPDKFSMTLKKSSTDPQAGFAGYYSYFIQGEIDFELSMAPVGLSFLQEEPPYLMFDNYLGDSIVDPTKTQTIYDDNRGVITATYPNVGDDVTLAIDNTEPSASLYYNGVLQGTVYLLEPFVPTYAWISTYALLEEVGQTATVTLVDRTIEGYVPLTIDGFGGSAIDETKYPQNNQGKGYEIVGLDEPTQWGELDKEVKNGDFIVFDNAGVPQIINDDDDTTIKGTWKPTLIGDAPIATLDSLIDLGDGLDGVSFDDTSITAPDGVGLAVSTMLPTGGKLGIWSKYDAAEMEYAYYMYSGFVTQAEMDGLDGQGPSLLLAMLVYDEENGLVYADDFDSDNPQIIADWDPAVDSVAVVFDADNRELSYYTNRDNQVPILSFDLEALDITTVPELAILSAMGGTVSGISTFDIDGVQSVFGGAIAIDLTPPENAANNAFIIDVADPVFIPELGKVLKSGDIVFFDKDGSPLRLIQDDASILSKWKVQTSKGSVKLEIFNALAYQSDKSLVPQPEHYYNYNAAQSFYESYEFPNPESLGILRTPITLDISKEYVVCYKTDYKQSIMMLEGMNDVLHDIFILDNVVNVDNQTHYISDSDRLVVHFEYDDYYAYWVGHLKISSDLNNTIFTYSVGNPTNYTLVAYSYKDVYHSQTGTLYYSILDYSIPTEILNQLSAEPLLFGTVIDEDPITDFKNVIKIVDIDKPTFFNSLNDTIENNDVIFFDENSKPIRVVKKGGGSGIVGEDVITKSKDVIFDKKWTFVNNTNFFGSSDESTISFSFNHDESDIDENDPFSLVHTFGSHTITGEPLHGNKRWLFTDVALGGFFTPVAKMYYYERSDTNDVIIFSKESVNTNPYSTRNVIKSSIKYQDNYDFGYTTLKFDTTDQDYVGNFIRSSSFEWKTPIDNSGQPEILNFNTLDKILVKHDYNPAESNALITQGMANSKYKRTNEILTLTFSSGGDTSRYLTKSTDYIIDVIGSAAYIYSLYFYLPNDAAPNTVIKIFETVGYNGSIVLYPNGKNIKRSSNTVYISDIAWKVITLTYLNDTVGWVYEITSG